ncbi:hemin-degrading factor [Benzoatithermus flavus]|uniref:ChuX/HutX family heme-like substrate-binding protein n=1 Tax=Benzoatithermus flavus TaxID=3108223 RepID=A0ABU8XTU9_9PROT
MPTAFPILARPHPDAIRADAARLKQAEGLRARDLAARLGISEAELLAAHAGFDAPVGMRVTRLRPEWPALLCEVPRLGTVMALTRNEVAVHEKVGAYGDLRFSGEVGGAFGRLIDLRLFLRHWRFGFAVEEASPSGPPRRSFQFFAADGTAVHKIHLKEYSDHRAFAELAAGFAIPEQDAPLAVAPSAGRPLDRPDDMIDREILRTRWFGLGDVHRFHGLLEDLGAGREQAFRLVGDDLAWQVEPHAFQLACERAVEDDVSIMIFVPNPGCIQIHTGTIQRLKAVGPWWNILDPGFNLHLREDLVARAWVARKHTDLGVVTSLELFDAAGGLILMMFGERAPEAEETASWRRIAASLPRLAADA